MGPFQVNRGQVFSHVSLPVTLDVCAYTKRGIKAALCENESILLHYQHGVVIAGSCFPAHGSPKCPCTNASLWLGTVQADCRSLAAH